MNTPAPSSDSPHPKKTKQKEKKKKQAHLQLGDKLTDVLLISKEMRDFEMDDVLLFIHCFFGTYPTKELAKAMLFNAFYYTLPRLHGGHIRDALKLAKRINRSPKKGEAKESPKESPKECPNAKDEDSDVSILLFPGCAYPYFLTQKNHRALGCAFAKRKIDIWK